MFRLRSVSSSFSRLPLRRRFLNLFSSSSTSLASKNGGRGRVREIASVWAFGVLCGVGGYAGNEVFNHYRALVVVDAKEKEKAVSTKNEEAKEKTVSTKKDDDEEAKYEAQYEAELKKNYEAEQERSETRGPERDPENPSVHILVGDSVQDKVLQNKEQDVIIAFYSDDCRHCLLLKPVYEQLAYAFQDVPQVMIAKMNTDKNWRKGLLTFQQYAGGSPIIKVFRAHSTPEEKIQEAVELRRPSAQGLIEEIYQHRKGGWTEEEKTQVIQKAQSYQKESRKKYVKNFLTERKIYSFAPCGPELLSCLESATSGLATEEDLKKFHAYIDCRVKEKKDDVIEFWMNLGQLADYELEMVARQLQHQHHQQQQKKSKENQTQEKAKDQGKKKEKL
jgi:thiol-disulfide isomerase/thioredoxin